METFSWHNSISRKTIPKMALAVFIVFYLISILIHVHSLALLSPNNTISIWDGYLCDLIEPSIPGLYRNTARPFAVVALWSICFGLLFLWRKLITVLRPNYGWYQIIWHGLGLFSIFLMLLLPFGNHDRIIFFSGMSGIFSVLFVCLDLAKNRCYEQLWAGILFLVALTSNNLLYLIDFWVDLLPMIQKFTLLSFVVWYLLLDKLTPK
nr:hypothetical protein [uncultured Allomuricauda sp.]